MLMDLFQKALMFVLVLGVLIAFHEFGHFWVARKLGVKVLRFSVGFGKPLLRYQSNPSNPEYVLAAIPLGGYVKMLDEREADVTEDEKHLAFNQQSVWTRIAIVAAGPLFNLILAVILFWFVFISGVPELKAVLDQPEENTIAYALNIQSEDVVVAVNDAPVESWSDLRLFILQDALKSSVLNLRLKSPQGGIREIELDTSSAQLFDGNEDAFERLGLRVWNAQLPTIIGKVMADSAADQGGLLNGDQVISIDGVEVNHWADLVEQIRNKPDQNIRVGFVRNGIKQAQNLILGSVDRRGQKVGQLGVQPKFDPYENYRITQQYSAFPALQKSLLKTWDTSLLILRMMKKIIFGEASVKNLSGPLTIAQYAGESAKIGLTYLLQFMAAISVSLGVLNLLPIPVLDGGHLLYYVVELVKGSPVSERIMLIGQQFGLAVLLMMMCVAFYNDIARIFG